MSETIILISIDVSFEIQQKLEVKFNFLDHGL